MIVVMKKDATENDINFIIDEIKGLGLSYSLINGEKVKAIALIGDKTKFLEKKPQFMHGVDKIVHISDELKFSKNETANTSFVSDISFGHGNFVIIAGPCSVESKEQLYNTAKAVKASGAKILRAGTYKPRTSPYSFQGLKEEGLKILYSVGKELNMPVVSEVVSEENLKIAVDYLDILQIGSRNMQNFELLKAVGRTNKPVILKRGFCSTIDEWLSAAEYILCEGNEKVILCERGIRTFETSTRFTLDISSVPVIHSKSKLPIIIDPSHASGNKNFVPDLCKAAVAVGADGIMVEVHEDPKLALSDSEQALNPMEFDKICKEIRKYLSF